jgi:hypothetical protein
MAAMSSCVPRSHDVISHHNWSLEWDESRTREQIEGEVPESMGGFASWAATFIGHGRLKRSGGS